MSPNYTTIITPIVSGREAALKQYLRDHADPRPGMRPCEDFLRCRPLFPFDKIKCLHFCSFSVLDDDGTFGPSLVFEATFDGPRADFLRELWRVAPAGMHAVYGQCVGYPASGLAVPDLIEDYLVRHDVGADTFFSGCPGRCAAQIQGESRVRSEMVAFLSNRHTAGTPPTTPAALQLAMQRDVIRNREENRWAEQPAVTPWEVANRAWVACAAALAAGAAVLGLGVVAVRAAFGMWPLDLCAWIACTFRQLWELGLSIARSEYAQWTRLTGLTRELELPILYLIAMLALAWMGVRLAELFLRARTENPRRQSFWWRLALHLMFILKIAIPIFMVGLAALGLATNALVPASDAAPKAGRSHVGDIVAASPWVTVGLILVIAVVWLLLRHWTKTLKLAVQFQELPRWKEDWRRFALDVLAFVRVVFLVLSALLLARHLPDGFADKLAEASRPWIYVYLLTAAYALAGVLAAYIVGSLFFLVVKALELRDCRQFDGAEALSPWPAGGQTWVREEGGINRHQNHLASLTYVKPGRRWLLRSTLFVIHLLSRFWFNRGTLGGIPTILSARWVMIDGGRRLLFLDNYGGAWNSYLNEFIDMGAVKGLNAIWTNTFVKPRSATKGHAWPRTSYYLWEGAQAEPAFKAYVRQSQIETLAWYGAYPTLSITNVNANTELRQCLFKPMASCDIDAVVQRL